MENEFILEAPSNAELTHAAARDLTDRINTASEDLAAMLQRAHDGKAWLALGHRSWKDYLATEIKLSKQHAHRLLEFSKTREEIQKSPMGDLPMPKSERQVRALTKLPPQERPKAYAVAVEAAGGASPTAKQVEMVVQIEQDENTPERAIRIIPSGKKIRIHSDGEWELEPFSKTAQFYFEVSVDFARQKFSADSYWLKQEIRIFLHRLKDCRLNPTKFSLNFKEGLDRLLSDGGTVE